MALPSTHNDQGYEEVIYDFLMALRYATLGEARRMYDNAVEDPAVHNLDSWRRINFRFETVFRSAQHDVADMHTLNNPPVAKMVNDVLGHIESWEHAVRQLSAETQHFFGTKRIACRLCKTCARENYANILRIRGTPNILKCTPK